MNESTIHINESTIHIDQVSTPAGGTIGMTHCPGRKGIDGDGHHWNRQLDRDLHAIKAWGAMAIITLLQRREFEKLGVADIDQAVTAQGMRWYHLPIADMAAPAAEFEQAFASIGAEIIQCLDGGAESGRLVLHCAAGLGRTGTVAASLLIHYGLTPQLAITTVRDARPGAIETPAQERFVREAGILKYTTASHRRR